MLRPISVKHYLSTMRASGLHDEQLVAGTAINPAALEDPDYLISHEDYQHFVHNMVRLQGDCGLGLELGLGSEALHFGVLAHAGLSCCTLRQGMHEVWSRYGKAFGISTQLAVVDENQTQAVIEIQTPFISEALYRFSIEESLSVLLKISGAWSSQLAPFSTLALPYAKPAYGERYQAIFGCRTTFDAPAARLSVSRAWLDSPLKSKDAELHRVCLAYLEDMLRLTEAASPLSLQLRQWLLERIQTMPSCTEAANALGLSPRTLTRQLQKQGYTYRGLTEEIRVTLVQNWLQMEGVSAKEASHRLGFSDVATFRRAFKSWTGMTLGQQGEKLKNRSQVTPDPNQFSLESTSECRQITPSHKHPQVSLFSNRYRAPTP